MNPRVLSVNVGSALPTKHSGKPTTGIDKLPTTHIEVHDPGTAGDAASGVLGDAVVDVRFHGGWDKAVYAFAREELDWWEPELGRDLRSGIFGENLTTIDFDVDESVVGERWHLGDAVLQVTAPRIPCRTFAGHLGESGWVKRFSARGRSGSYLAVIAPGVIATGVSIERRDIPDHGVTIREAFAAQMGDRAAVERLTQAGLVI